MQRGNMAEDDRFYKDIIDNLYDGVYFVDRERVITYWNKGAERITGYKSEQVIGRACRDSVLNHVNNEGIELCGNHCPLAECMADGIVREADVFVHHADGHRVPVLVRAAPLRDGEGKIIGAVETFSGDVGMISVRQQLRELRHTARTDALTGIGNRLLLEGRLRALLVEYIHQRGGAGVAMMDIDHFKVINDTYGHDVGDKMLRMVATTLKHNLRGSDTVGRWGGEEFVAILYDVPSLEALKIICEKLRALVENSRLDLADKSLRVTVSIGATLLLPHDTPEILVRRADEMMYQVKQAGRNRVIVG